MEIKTTEDIRLSKRMCLPHLKEFDTKKWVTVDEIISRLKSIEQSQDFNELKTLISELAENTKEEKK